LRAALIASVTVLVYALHQDFWFWRTARPLVFGFLPIGLFYHAAYTALISVFMWYLVRHYWPAHLEDANERQRVSHAGGPPSPRSGSGEVSPEPARPIVRVEADGAKPPARQ
jgi:hypothetical protein